MTDRKGLASTWLRFAVPITVVLVVWSLTTHGKPSVSGDEPHYLIIAESLWADHDLDLGNNYRANDTAKFGHDQTDPGPHVLRNRDGALWSVHDIGLPVLLLPIYVPATRLAAFAPTGILARFRQTPGLFAYSIITFALTLLTAFAASLMFAGLRRVTSAGRAAAITLMLTLSPPVLAHAFLVFPEGPAFAVACAVMWLICLGEDELSGTRVAALMLALGLMPWLHRKYSLFALGLAFVIMHRHRTWFASQSRRRLVGLALLVLVPQMAFHAWTLWAWGTIRGPQLMNHLLFSVGGFPTGSRGLLLDREYGLLAYAPIYLVVPVCFLVEWRRQWDLIVPVLVLFVPMAAFDDWHGGFSPAARYLVALTPLLALVVARPLARVSIRALAIGLVVFQLAINAYVWQHPRTMWPNGSGTNRVLEALPFIGPAYEHLLPTFGITGHDEGG